MKTKKIKLFDIKWKARLVQKRAMEIYRFHNPIPTPQESIEFTLKTHAPTICKTRRAKGYKNSRLMQGTNSCRNNFTEDLLLNRVVKIAR